jgi:serine/threonine-protein kinase RsbW
MAKLMDNILSAYGDYKELEDIRKYVRERAENFGLSESKVNNITLAVDEACSNLIHYNINFDAKKTFNICIVEKTNQFSVVIQDSGKSFNLMRVKCPDMNKYFKEMKHGGLGIHIIKKIVDKIEYIAATSSNKVNTLTLTMLK